MMMELDVLFSSLLLSKFVSVLFWALYFIDRELVFPTVLDPIIPPWINHIMHTLPLVTVLSEQYLVDHKYPSALKGLSILVTFIIAYGSW